jgi:hypothetical protein
MEGKLERPRMCQIIKRRLESRYLFRGKNVDGSSRDCRFQGLQLSHLPNHDWAGLHDELRI